MSKTQFLAGPPQRQAALIAERHAKMARSAQDYVRANTENFYKQLAASKHRPIPQGPPIWICGDCHAGNLGPIANAKGEIDVFIRDFDQTVIGNPVYDLVRLGLSMASAARSSDLPGVTMVKMMANIIAGYEEALAAANEGDGCKVEKPKSVKAVLRDALNRKWKDLARERIEGPKPTIPLGKRFWPLSKSERAEMTKLFATDEVRCLVTSLRSRKDDSPIQVMDAAYWVKGCSSLGRMRYAVLLGIGKKADELCLIDIKQAVPVVVPCAPKAGMPRDNAQRVVAGACHLSPALGKRMLAAHFQEQPVFLRELLPQDLKFEVQRLDSGEALEVAKYLAAVVGKAHARQMERRARQAWQKKIAHARDGKCSAPDWLWSSVCELMVGHEGGYLEHCRNFCS